MASAYSLASASLAACRTSLLYSQFMQPARTNQSINIIQSWQGKTVTGSLLQTELHTQPHNCFGALRPNIQWMQPSNSLSSVQIPFSPQVRHVYLPALSIFQSCPYVGFYRLSLVNVITSLHTRRPDRYLCTMAICQLSISSHLHVMYLFSSQTVSILWLSLLSPATTTLLGRQCAKFSRVPFLVAVPHRIRF